MPCPSSPLRCKFKIAAVLNQPVDVVQPLIDDVLVLGLLVFDDRRSAFAVETQRVNPPRLFAANHEFGGDEAHAIDFIQVHFDDLLKLTFQPERTGCDPNCLILSVEAK